MIFSRTLMFASMNDYVVLDEKWFHISVATRTFYLWKGEPERELSGKSSRYTPKVMFFAAIARPRFDDNCEHILGGKIVFWPLIEISAAKSNSRNKTAGTLQPKSVSVNRDVCRKFIVEKLFHAIRRKWPGPKSDLILIQQDNAPFHDSTDDVDVAAEGQRFR